MPYVCNRFWWFFDVSCSVAVRLSIVCSGGYRWAFAGPAECYVVLMVVGCRKILYVGPGCGEMLLGLSNRSLTNRVGRKVSFRAILGVYGPVGRYISTNMRINVMMNNNGF